MDYCDGKGRVVQNTVAQSSREREGESGRERRLGGQQGFPVLSEDASDRANSAQGPHKPIRLKLA